MNVVDKDADVNLKVYNAKIDNDALESLLIDYEPLIIKIVRGYNINGFERDDLLQEGRAAFCAAVKSYDPQNGAKFPTYASVCINRRLGDLFKGSVAVKRNGTTLRMDEAIDDQVDWTLVGVQTLEEKVIEAQERADIANKIRNSLTPFELKVIQLFLDGYKYKDMVELLIAEFPNATIKSIDNALVRARKKIKDII